MRIKCFRFAIGLVCFLLVVSLQRLSAQRTNCREADSLCGPNSLLIICQKFGVKTDLEELKALSGYEAEASTTMLGLQRAAEAKGLHAVGMKIGVDELAGLKMPAIAHLWSDHFVVVESASADPDTLKVTNPPGEPRLVSKQDFAKSYSGFALLVAKDADSFPKPEAAGPDIRFDGYIWDFGSIDEGELAYHTFKARNAGNEDLVISKAVSYTHLTLPTTPYV